MIQLEQHSLYNRNNIRYTTVTTFMIQLEQHSLQLQQHSLQLQQHSLQLQQDFSDSSRKA